MAGYKELERMTMMDDSYAHIRKAWNNNLLLVRKCFCPSSKQTLRLKFHPLIKYYKHIWFPECTLFWSVLCPISGGEEQQTMHNGLPVQHLDIHIQLFLAMKVVSQGTKTFGEPTCLEPHTSGWNMLFETLKDINQHVGKKRKTHMRN